MADVGEEEEYESDPEQSKLSLTMRRRREASDDEEEVDDDDDDEVRVRGRARVIDSRVSDYESDDQGAAAEYDDDEYDIAEEEELLEEVEDEELVQGRGRSEVQGVKDGVIEGSSVGVKRENDQTDGDGFYAPESADQFDDNANGTVGEGEGEGEGGQEEKKENEPFQVPTAGAFYMHDDRFRDSAGGRHRRGLGRGKLWENRDDRKWGHDKFEELSQERHYDEGRRAPRGRNRGPRGRNRGGGGEDRNFAPGNNRPKTYNNNNNNNNQTNAPKPVRGRGPRKYQPSSQNNFEPPSQNRQPGKSMEKAAHGNSGRTSAATSASESTQVPARKNVLASNLNSASPPFYPSGNKETKKEPQSGPVNRRENYPVSQSNNMRGGGGRNMSDSLNMDKLYIDDSGPSFNPSTTTTTQRVYQPVPPHHQVNRVSSPNPNQNQNQNQVHSFQRGPALNQIHPNTGQQFGQRSASGSRASSPPKESTEIESPTESNDSKTALVGKGKSSIQAGMTSFPYHGDQNFPGAPTFLPVMQFAGQHPGGLGVPAVGMAFPGYVAQPNGMGNSEMTWLPVLAGAAGAIGAAGALGAQYCSPYITMDGAYHARPSGQTSSLPPPSKDGSTNNKPGSEVKPSQRPEVANDELRQRQNKARRYTEMKFDK